MYSGSDEQEQPPLRENGTSSGQQGVPTRANGAFVEEKRLLPSGNDFTETEQIGSGFDQRHVLLFTINYDKASINPQFKTLLIEVIDFLNESYDNDCKHGAIGDLKRFGLLDDGLGSFKIFTTGRLGIDEAEDLHGFFNMLDQLKLKKHGDPYFDNFLEILRDTMRTRDRSFKDTLQILKSHPLLSDSSYKKKITYDLCNYWNQHSPYSHTYADEKCFSSLAVGTSCDSGWIYTIRKCKIEYLVHSARIAPTFPGLVLFVTNKIKDVWGYETVLDNVQASVTEDEFFEKLYELFPDFYIIIFKYIYCSQRMFAQRPSGTYPSEGYNVMNVDRTIIPASQTP